MHLIDSAFWQNMPVEDGVIGQWKRALTELDGQMPFDWKKAYGGEVGLKVQCYKIGRMSWLESLPLIFKKPLGWVRFEQLKKRGIAAGGGHDMSCRTPTDTERYKIGQHLAQVGLGAMTIPNVLHQVVVPVNKNSGLEQSQLFNEIVRDTEVANVRQKKFAFLHELVHIRQAQIRQQGGFWQLSDSFDKEFLHTWDALLWGYRGYENSLVPTHEFANAWFNESHADLVAMSLMGIMEGWSFGTFILHVSSLARFRKDKETRGSREWGGDNSAVYQTYWALGLAKKNISKGQWGGWIQNGCTTETLTEVEKFCQSTVVEAAYHASVFWGSDKRINLDLRVEYWALLMMANNLRAEELWVEKPTMVSGESVLNSWRVSLKTPTSTTTGRTVEGTGPKLSVFMQWVDSQMKYWYPGTAMPNWSLDELKLAPVGFEHMPPYFPSNLVGESV